MDNQFCFRRSESYIPTFLSEKLLAISGLSVFTQYLRFELSRGCDKRIRTFISFIVCKGVANTWTISFASSRLNTRYRQIWLKKWLAISSQSFFTQDCRYIGLTLTEAKMIGHGLARPLHSIYKMKVWILLSQPQLNSNLKHYYLTLIHLGLTQILVCLPI